MSDIDDTAPLGARTPTGPTGAAIIVAAGAGGTDAHTTALEIAKMIEAYALKLGFGVFDAVEEKPKDGGPGVTMATFAVRGETAFDRLVMLTGVHRICRRSPTDPENRRITSFASVTVAPLVAWGSLRYSYVLDPYSKATNHQTGATVDDAQAVLDGNLDLILGTAP